MNPINQTDSFLIPHNSHYPSPIDNETTLETVLLVPSTFATQSEWDLVVPFLLAKGKYHLIVPDFSCFREKTTPGLAIANFSQPFTIQNASSLLAHLVTEVAIDGRAKVVGLSLGAIIAIGVASIHPEIVNGAVFVSGYEVYPHLSSGGMAPYGLWLLNRLETLIPSTVVSWAMDGADLQKNLQPESKNGLSLCKEIIRCLSGIDSWPPKPWPSRTMVVAAGKKNWYLPSADRADDAKKLAEVGKCMNNSTVAVVHPLMRHPWHRQAPELFAEAAWIWFEEGRIKEGFNLL